MTVIEIYALAVVIALVAAAVFEFAGPKPALRDQMQPIRIQSAKTSGRQPSRRH